MFNTTRELSNQVSTDVVLTCENCEGTGSIEIHNAYDLDFKKVEICECCRGTGLVAVSTESFVN